MAVSSNNQLVFLEHCKNLIFLYYPNPDGCEENYKYVYTLVYTHIYTHTYIHIRKVGDHSQGRHEGSLFISHYTKV